MSKYKVSCREITVEIVSEIMSKKKRNRDKIKSGSVSPKESKRLNMAMKRNRFSGHN